MKASIAYTIYLNAKSMSFTRRKEWDYCDKSFYLFIYFFFFLMVSKNQLLVQSELKYYAGERLFEAKNYH